MAQTTRPCIECGAQIARTHPYGAINSLCSRECKLARRRRTRPEQPTLAQPCKGCGASIPRTGKAGKIKEYCADGCKPRCSIDGCQHPIDANQLCGGHYQRTKTGYPLAGQIRPQMPAKGHVCVIDGCDKPRYKRGWCLRHYATWKAHGDPLAEVKRWAPRATACRMCGSPTVANSREYCSAACQAAERRAVRRGQEPPRSPIPCGICAGPVPTIRINGRKVRGAGSLICDTCQRRRRPRHGVTPQSLVDERGASCGFCRNDVDMDLRWPDPMSATVDHVIPYARGGTDERENLQLCHFRCNASKRASLAT